MSKNSLYLMIFINHANLLHQYYNSYKNNARTTGISFINFKNQAVLYEGPLKDTSKPQRLDVSSDAEGNNNLEQVGISFFDYDFIPGEKWNDLCIAYIIKTQYLCRKY